MGEVMQRQEAENGDEDAKEMAESIKKMMDDFEYAIMLSTAISLKYPQNLRPYLTLH